MNDAIIGRRVITISRKQNYKPTLKV